MQTLYSIALIIHIMGLTLMAGTTLVDYMLTKQFWKRHAKDKSGAVAINEAGSKFPMLFAIGIILLILSGVTMMGITHGVFGEQIWFQIKFGLIILIIINGLGVGRTQGSKLKKLLSQEIANTHPDDLGEQENRRADFRKIKDRINWFHLSQIAFFIVVFTLSVFKFN
jgi:hypothetical protein